MDKLAPGKIDPNELPDGFTAANPNAPNGGAGSDQPTEGQRKDEQKQMVLQQALTADALERLQRIKLVKQEKASAVENLVVSMAMQGKLPGPVNEGRLIEMLEELEARKGMASSSRISIQRKKYTFDSDDDDDDDTDLM